jgi:hypothetical protein
MGKYSNVSEKGASSIVMVTELVWLDAEVIQTNEFSHPTEGSSTSEHLTTTYCRN